MKKMRKQQKASERGSTLVIALAVIVGMTMLGIAALQMTGADTQASGREAGASKALYIAEVGITQGVRELEDEPFSLPQSNVDDHLSTEFGILGTNKEASGYFKDFYLLHSNVSYEGGSYTVGVKPYIDGNPDDDRVIVRSMGRFVKATRIVEVMIDAR